ncbi:MAG: cupin [Sphingomonas bacterium]|jgi:mannose-6-phosphate isomerase-like protein (cupin superfamily)|uniref:cupin domain-containing protein n=1 Tax=Sphingomonas bacterium TaxID=1895847 RepID=UPI00261950D2|nr:cupin domain-containing protein [Sphingomonas bacterium]MDB5705076.1 cupin [Sphingomonas bacterium]
MKHRRYGVGIALLALTAATPGWSQATPAPVAALPAPTYVSAADIAAMIAKAEQDPRAATAVITQPLLQLSPYRPIIHRRTTPAGADLHEKQAEFFMVVRGSGTLTTGGRLVRPASPAGAPLPPASIEGGTDRKVGQGDFFVVPENTPHQFTKVDGELVLISMHVPRPVPAP